jgi:hypothetical protein
VGPPWTLDPEALPERPIKRARLLLSFHHRGSTSSVLAALDAENEQFVRGARSGPSLDLDDEDALAGRHRRGLPGFSLERSVGPRTFLVHTGYPPAAAVRDAERGEPPLDEFIPPVMVENVERGSIIRHDARSDEWAGGCLAVIDGRLIQTINGKGIYSTELDGSDPQLFLTGPAEISVGLLEVAPRVDR